ncbi:MAG: uroporphyrinogen-III synthase [Desulfovibrionaceae bacterium]|jgi:uroporphyrinogen-III synthase|nr:uroporphyrinogen-III synthase [Desulfovibrionaceae bacterium]
MPPPRIIITRPAREAARWARELGVRGLSVCTLPLIEIAPEPLTGALASACQRLGAYQAAMFVSANAVHGLLGQEIPPGLAAQTLEAIETRAWSTGPGTTRAVLDAGWPVARVDEPPSDAAQFDSESLWARVQGQVRPGLRVLIVRGGDADGRLAGRGWLAGQLQAAGAAVDQVVAYRRAAPALDGAQRALAESAAQDGSLWLFSSSEAIANLCAALPRQDWSAAVALATHPRIAQAARAAGFGAVRDAPPVLGALAASVAAVTASIESGA